MIRKLLLIGFATALVACSETKKPAPIFGTASDTEEQVTEETTEEVLSKREGTIEAAVTQLYDDILPQYTATESPDIAEVNKMYCTEDLAALWDKSKQKEKETGKLIIDWDWWIQSQGAEEGMTMTIESVKDEGMEGYAIVHINMQNGDVRSKLLFRKVNEKWLVDDIFYFDEGDWHSTRKLIRAQI